MSRAESRAPFGQRTVLLGIAASLIAGLLFFVLATYAPDAPGSRGAAATPTSDSAVGYSGFVQLLQAAGPPTETVRRAGQLDRPGLMIVFLDMVDDPERIGQIVAARRDQPTLFVLPKWQVRPIGLSSKRVQSDGVIDAVGLTRLLQPIAKAGVTRRARGSVEAVAGYPVRLPPSAQLVAGATLFVPGYPLGLLTRVPDTPHFILADPDLINNAHIDDLGNARAMMAMVDALTPPGAPVLIATARLSSDGGRNLGRLLLDPPFLPLTLILLFAGLLALLHGFARFGPIAPRARTFAFGQSALIDRSADLLARAGKVAGLGPRYGDTLRRRAAERLGAPAGLSGARLEVWLDTRGQDADGPQPFTRRLRALDSAGSEEELHQRARALASWIEGQT